MAHCENIADNGIPLEEVSVPTAQDPIERLSDWDTEHRFRRMARTLHRSGETAPRRAVTLSTPHYRIDKPQGFAAEIGRPLVDLDAATGPVRRMPTAYRPPHDQASGSQFMAWMMVCLGMVVFACGVGLGYQSLVKSEQLYWEIAIGLALVGQGLLILGLVLVLSWLWRNSRRAIHQLQEIHQQLSEVQRAAQAFVGQRQNSAPAFYAELARGASPQMLLASLRGQLEQLAARVNV